MGSTALKLIQGENFMKFIDRKKWFIVGTIGALLVCIPMQAAGYKKNKVVNYHPVKLYYNGEQTYLSTMPISIDGTTYLPARAFCNALGLEMNWDQSGGNLYTNSGSQYTSVLSLQTELRAKEYEIASLKQELAKLKPIMSTSSGSSYESTSGTDILGAELTATQNELENLYGDYFKGIDLDFRVRVSGSRLSVKISYDTSGENKAFNNLSTREIKDFAEEICDTVRSRHDDIIIDGTIIYTDSNTSKYEFSYSKKNNLTYGSHYDFSETDVINAIKKVDSIVIRDYSQKINMSKVEATINDTREVVTFKIYIDVTAAIKEAWNMNKGTDTDSALSASLRDIARNIENITDYDIQGKVYDINNKDNAIATYDYEDHELDKLGIQ